MPLITPAELWKRSGRYDIDEVFKLKDRRGAELVLALSHEETVTLHVAQAVRSYRELPMLLYHFQTKGRDEARPRAGVLRTREFIMKDAYSFDRDEEGLRRPTTKFVEAYDRIFDRFGLEWYRVESDVGMMGGTGAHEYMAPCAAGENDVALAPGYAANIEVASADPQPVRRRSTLEGELHTPGPTTIAAVAGGLGVQRRQRAQGLPGGDRVARAGAWSSCAATTASTRSSSPTRCGEPFRPAREDELRGPRRLPRARRTASRRCYDDAIVARAGLRDGRQPPRLPPRGHRRRRRARRRAHRRGGRHRQRQPDPDRARHRDRQHLQARHPLLRAAGGDLPRRERQGAADRHGLLRHRPGAHHGRRDRAVRRREGHLVAAGDRALGRRDRGHRQAGHARARRRRGALRRAARGGPRRAARRPRRRAGREVRRRRAAGRARCA